VDFLLPAGVTSAVTRREQWQRVVALALWCDLLWTLLTVVVPFGTVLTR
jgi:hypothetical protein